MKIAKPITENSALLRLLRLLRQGLALSALLGALFSAPALCQSATPTPAQLGSKNILLLYSYGHGSRGIALLDDGLLDALGGAGIGLNNLFFEYLDLERNQADSQYRANMRNLLMRKYANRDVDVIVTVQQPALGFLLQEGQNLAPGAAAITLQAPMPSLAQAGKRRIISHLNSFDIKGTIEHALALFPDTRRVVFVAGSSEADRKMAATAAQVASPWQDKLALEYTSDLPLPAMLQRVASLPPHTIVIFTQYNRDTSGQVTVAYEVESMIVKAANAPVFGLYDFNLRNGGIGGSVVGVRDLGERTGRLAIDLLGGRLRPSAQVAEVDIKPIPMFNWTQIQRWGGDPQRLPANSIFVNRTPSFWAQYKVYIVVVLAFILAQSMLTAALLVNRRRRQQTEEFLRESEARYRVLVEQAPDAIALYDVDAERFVDCNAAAERLFGCPRQELLLAGPERFYLPEQFHGRSPKAVMQESIEMVLSGQQIILERKLCNAAGQDLICEVRLVSMPAVRQRLVRASYLDVTERRKTQDELQRRIAQLQRSLMSTVEVATSLGELRDPYTAGHQHRVGNVAADIGIELGLSEQQIEGLRVAGLLHDVGKITIPTEILSKPGKLSALEYQLIQAHPQAGYDVLKSVEFPWPVAQVALQHHERMDGSGYPQGLKGEAILLEARIMAVADVIEAMSSDRPYRAGLGLEAALAAIESGRGTLFDTAVVDACLRLMRQPNYALPAD